MTRSTRLIWGSRSGSGQSLTSKRQPSHPTDSTSSQDLSMDLLKSGTSRQGKSEKIWNIRHRWVLLSRERIWYWFAIKAFSICFRITLWWWKRLFYVWVSQETAKCWLPGPKEVRLLFGRYRQDSVWENSKRHTAKASHRLISPKTAANWSGTSPKNPSSRIEMQQGKN